MDPESVSFAKEAIDEFLRGAVEADKDGDDLLVTVYLEVAYEYGLEAFHADVWAMQTLRQMPADWRLRYPCGR